MHMTECTESTQPPRTTPAQPPHCAAQPPAQPPAQPSSGWVGGRAGGRATYSTFGLLALRLSKAITKR